MTLESWTFCFGYSGNKIYEDGTLKKILIDNGYIENGIYYFYVRDHLGNNRIVADAGGNVIQKTDYYPFGMPTSASTAVDAQPYKYNGKEYEMMNGLNQYDYHARQYDPAIIRFNTPDPLAEKYYSISPYVYCNNNPIKYTDPTGMAYQSRDPSQWVDLLNHLSSGGSVNTYNTSAWNEVDDPELSGAIASTNRGGPSVGDYINMFFNYVGTGLGLDYFGRESGSAKSKAAKRLNNTSKGLKSLGQIGFYMIPVVGSAAEAIDNYKAGNYLGATTAVAFVIVDIASLGEGSMAKGFFKGATYSSKVTKQMNLASDLYHAFPGSVDGFADSFGKLRTITGGDGKMYQILEVAGSYGGKTGTFEYIKDANGVINHRFFKVP